MVLILISCTNLLLKNFRIMTRKGEIRNAKDAFYDNMLKGGDYYGPRDCFEEGAEWADANPKSPWISTKEDLPCNHEELISPDDKRDTKYVVALIHGYIVMSRMRKMDGKWNWENDEPTYWMAIPEPPKE